MGPAEIAYAVEGAGPPVLLLHGFPTHSYLWRRVMRALADDARCVAPDLPGLGDTEISPYHDFTLPMQAEAMFEFLDALAWEDVVLVGHDIGGGVAQVMVTLHPERFRALVLVDSVAYDAWPPPEVRRRQRLLQVPGLRSMARASAPLIARSRRFGLDAGTWSPDGLPDDAIEEYLRPIRDRDGWIRFTRTMLGLDARTTRDLPRPLHTVDLPARVVWGADDPFLPAGIGRRLADDLPGARLRLFDHCGHWVPEERPDELAGVICEFTRGR